jgi:hypothetical protein
MQLALETLAQPWHEIFFQDSKTPAQFQLVSLTFVPSTIVSLLVYACSPKFVPVLIDAFLFATNQFPDCIKETSICRYAERGKEICQGIVASLHR